MDDNSFASLVGKLNSIDAGRKPHERQFKAKDNHIKEGMKANDMTSILENMYRDVPFESAKSLDSATTKQFKPGYKPKQLPADYKMPDVGPVLGGDEEKIPTKGYMVGDSIDPDMIAKLAGDADEIDIKDKGEYDEEGAMSKDQLARAADAALELQGILDDDENLPEWVQNKITKALDYLDTSRDYMKQELDEYTPQPGSEESWDGVSPDTDQTLSGPINPAPKGAQLPEDHVGKKKSILDYLGDIEQKKNEEMLAEPVKTFKTNDGKEMKIYGTEDDGYRVKVNGKESKKSFGKLSDAVLACETFVQRSRDYASEK
jgi:hypothetical protein